jgi:hypothetical protein
LVLIKEILLAMSYVLVLIWTPMTISFYIHFPMVDWINPLIRLCEDSKNFNDFQFPYTSIWISPNLCFPLKFNVQLQNIWHEAKRELEMFIVNWFWFNNNPKYGYSFIIPSSIIGGGSKPVKLTLLKLWSIIRPSYRM